MKSLGKGYMSSWPDRNLSEINLLLHIVKTKIALSAQPMICNPKALKFNPIYFILHVRVRTASRSMRLISHSEILFDQLVREREP